MLFECAFWALLGQKLATSKLRFKITQKALFGGSLRGRYATQSLISSLRGALFRSLVPETAPHILVNGGRIASRARRMSGKAVCASKANQQHLERQLAQAHKSSSGTCPRNFQPLPFATGNMLLEGLHGQFRGVRADI